MFAIIYGNIPGSDLPRLQPRRAAVEELYQLHLGNPNKYTLKFIVETWGQLNARWAESLKESVNYLCHLRKVEQPTFEKLKETGTSMGQHGQCIFSLPDTFNLSDPKGYFRHQLLGALERDCDRVRWGQYYKGPSIIPNRNAGDAPKGDQSLFGPPLNRKERFGLRFERPQKGQRCDYLLGL